MTEPTEFHKMVQEVVDMVNNLTAEEARAIERMHGYGISPYDYRSFWD
jgi:hypothetical protein